MSYTAGNPGNIQTATEIIISAYEHLSPESLDVIYGPIFYTDVIPQESIDRNVAEGDTIYSKRVKDFRGAGAFRAVGSNDVNLVGVSQDKISTPIFNAAIGAVLDVQEIAQAEAARMRALGEGAVEYAVEAMAVASERHLEKTWFFGDTVVDGSGDPFWPGMLNYPTIPTTTVANPGSGTEWVNKSADEIIFDIQVAINTVFETTLQTSYVTDIYLPSAQFALITGLKAGTRANDEVIWRFTSEQNVTAATGRGDIRFFPLPYLAGAGAGGTDRMWVVETKRDNFMLTMPIPYRQRTTDTFAFLQYLFAEWKISPIVLPYPETQGFWDGI